MFKLGKVIRYFSKTETAIIELSSDIFLGERIRFMKDGYTLFEQKVEELRINYKKVDFAKAGSMVALKTNEKVEIGSEIFKC